MEFIKEENRIYCENENGEILAEITFQQLENNVYNIDHTFVDGSLRGQGIAQKLVKIAIDEIKKKNGKVKATCSYAKHYIEKNNISSRGEK